MLEATPPADPTGGWLFEYWFANDRTGGHKNAEIVDVTEGSLTFEIPISQPFPPGITARLRVTTRNWNDWQ
jgi:hypothetical protein